MPDVIERGRYYPDMPPQLEGEGIDAYTDRLTGADGTDRRPYDHPRNRQCSIGWHGECSDPQGASCKCPCHTAPVHTFTASPTIQITMHATDKIFAEQDLEVLLQNLQYEAEQSGGKVTVGTVELKQEASSGDERG